MKIAIHHRKGSFSSRWITYCEDNNIEYKLVNAYADNILDQISNSDAFMWHHSQSDYRDLLFAKQLLFSIEQSGKTVFPNFNTGWHFDDKLGQKYLFEAAGIKYAKSHAFYTKSEAIKWLNSGVTYPLVFKLRGGAGSSNVYLLENYKSVKKVINQAFRRGFKQFNPTRYISDRYKLYRAHKISLPSFLKSCARLFFPRELSKMGGVEKGYVYFQEFIPNDGFDYRLEIVGDKAIGTVRYARKNDFRASGSHNNYYDEGLFEKDVFKFGFDIAKRLKLQSCALDIVRNKYSGELFLIENSYCYGADVDEFDHGFWTEDGVLHKQPFNGFDWMIEAVINEVLAKKSKLKE